jgi:hypothetical protein
MNDLRYVLPAGYKLGPKAEPHGPMGACARIESRHGNQSINRKHRISSKT